MFGNYEQSRLLSAPQPKLAMARSAAMRCSSADVQVLRMASILVQHLMVHLCGSPFFSKDQRNVGAPKIWGDFIGSGH